MYIQTVLIQGYSTLNFDVRSVYWAIIFYPLTHTYVCAHACVCRTKSYLAIFLRIKSKLYQPTSPSRQPPPFGTENYNPRSFPRLDSIFHVSQRLPVIHFQITFSTIGTRPLSGQVQWPGPFVRDICLIRRDIGPGGSDGHAVERNEARGILFRSYLIRQNRKRQSIID